ncbi:MAG: dihydropteroate synthase [Gammaproteobacteria bacterium]|nr:dihydropteroate synthase [Gammaproteobacteria bacterium]
MTIFERLQDLTQCPILMGVLNATPDSFSDGGRYTEVAVAVERVRRMIQEGASIIDIGGESSQPGASPISDAEQIERVMPLLRTLQGTCQGDVMLSIDTRSPMVARAALSAGVSLVNDISAGDSPGMYEVVAEHDAGMVLMHMQGTPVTMQLAPQYDDVVTEVLDTLGKHAAAAAARGVARERILLDPGIGFGKTKAHNLALLAALPRFVALPYPILLGTSRKRFMGSICRETVFTDLVGATCATTALGVQAGVRVFRVHDVKANRQALEVAWAIQHSAT